MTDNLPVKNNSQILLYQTESGQTKIEVLLEDETVWLTQKLMAELFQTTIPNVNIHIKNIFEEGELDPGSVIKDFLTTAADGKNYRTKFYSLDMIISVGYRVKSRVATRFRQWATQRLREYIVKGFVLDDERLKNPDKPFDYFDELLRRIQDIRTSERRFYQKITDIYATSIDYDPTTELSLTFFKTIQNKLHWAITEKTAAELIYSRADGGKPNMGLTSWRGEKVRKQDVAIGKNYLDEDELRGLNNLVEQYLVFAQGQAMRRIPLCMNDWIEKLDGFLQLNDRNILEHAGKISHEMAMELAETEYEKFNRERIRYTDSKDSDFDETIKQIDIINTKVENQYND
ncbi:MAG: hydroxyacid dehydrogenase [Methanosarcinales archaeon]|nr:MAG: hydroxyacid dehydrogenase [Methanosarcinales archaeon]